MLVDDWEQKLTPPSLSSLPWRSSTIYEFQKIKRKTSEQVNKQFPQQNSIHKATYNLRSIRHEDKAMKTVYVIDDY